MTCPKCSQPVPHWDRMKDGRCARCNNAARRSAVAVEAKAAPALSVSDAAPAPVVEPAVEPTDTCQRCGSRDTVRQSGAYAGFCARCVNIGKCWYSRLGEDTSAEVRDRAVLGMLRTGQRSVNAGESVPAPVAKATEKPKQAAPAVKPLPVLEPRLVVLTPPAEAERAATPGTVATPEQADASEPCSDGCGSTWEWCPKCDPSPPQPGEATPEQTDTTAKPCAGECWDKTGRWCLACCKRLFGINRLADAEAEKVSDAINSTPWLDYLAPRVPMDLRRYVARSRVLAPMVCCPYFAEVGA